MKAKGLYVIFAVAALAAITGFIYFGTPVSQQASVGQLVQNIIGSNNSNVEN